MIFSIAIRDNNGRKMTFGQLSKRIQRNVLDRSMERVKKVLDTGAVNIRNIIIAGMRDSPPTGKLYSRGTNKKGKKKHHRASSPGNYPRVDSGGMIRSIKVDSRLFEVEVGSRISDPAYPVYLEEGTEEKGAVKMEPRPWLECSFKKEEPRIEHKVNDAIRKTIYEFTRGK